MPRLDHIALEVADMDRAIAFYTEKLGFSLRSRATNHEQQEDYCFLSSEGLNLELISDLAKTYSAASAPKRPYCLNA
jgi:catechol 2,3-dioxygenase-like lactoylglutathione lyase family enzyme